MTLNTDQNAARAATIAAHEAMVLYRDTTPGQAALAWIEALAAEQQAYMIDCAAEKLERSQIRLRQLLGMRDALISPDSSGTGHGFD